MRTLLTTVAVAVALTLSAGAPADVVELGAAKDNTLYGDKDGGLSNGQGQGIFCGRTNQSGLTAVRRALVQFDVSAIPAGSTVNSVEVHLNVGQALFPIVVDVELHRALADWGEGESDAGPPSGCDGGGGPGAPAEDGDATWLHTFFPGSTWQSPGGDFAAAVSASTDVEGPGPYTWGSTPGLVADVQAWVDGAAGNYGWIILGNESQGGTAKRFDSRETIDTGCGSQNPLLVIDFTPPASCPGDTNGDQVVNVEDLVNVITSWGTDDPDADVTGDGTVDVQDLVLVITEWGAC